MMRTSHAEIEQGLGHRLIALCLLLATLGVYWQVMGHDFVGYDDFGYVFRNPDVLRGLTWDGIYWAFTSIRNANWHPLAWISHMVDAQIYGLFAPGHIFTNVILHAISGLLLFLFLREATGTLWRSGAVAAIFLLHPMHVESVAWVSERKDVLCGLFWIAAMLGYLRYVRTPSLERYGLVLLLTACAMLSKPMAVTLPCVFLLLDYWPLGRVKLRQWSRTRPGRHSFPWPDSWLLLEKIPLLGLSLFTSYMCYLAQNTSGAVSSLSRLPLSVRLENSLNAYIRYIGKFFWPTDLSVFYPHPAGFGGVSLWTVVGCTLLFALITVWAVSSLRRNTWAFSGWFWYVGTLVPVIGLVQVGSQSMADRYSYLPYVGLSLIVVWAVHDLSERLALPRSIPALCTGFALLAMLPITYQQVGYWKDTASLFTHAASVTQNNFVAHTALSHQAAETGDTDAFYRHFTEACRISPAYVSNDHNKIGYYVALSGMHSKALYHFMVAHEANPGNVDVMVNLGILYGTMERHADALRWLDRAEAIAPGNPAIAYNREKISLAAHKKSGKDAGVAALGPQKSRKESERGTQYVSK